MYNRTYKGATTGGAMMRPYDGSDLHIEFGVCIVIVGAYIYAPEFTTGHNWEQ
jgi:hypothetical protein